MAKPNEITFTIEDYEGNKAEMFADIGYEYKHWCGNCQIRIYVQRHYGRLLTWQDCPYVCEYATEMRCSTEAKGESDERPNQPSGGD